MTAVFTGAALRRPGPLAAAGKGTGPMAVLGLALVLAASVCLSCRRTPVAGPGPIPSSGGERFSVTNAAVQPVFLQKDPRWAEDTIGGSGESVAAVGCTLCCVSMALAGYGIERPPGVLNEALKQAGGYTDRGWLDWEMVERVAGERVQVRVAHYPSHVEIDRALRDGHCAIVKIMLRGVLQHWVLVVGKRGKEYLVKDPLGTGDRLDKLSALAPEIHSLRLVLPRTP